jgi:importin-7
MSQQQPQLYNSLTAALGPEEQQVIQAALAQADKIENERQQAQATAAASGVTAQPNGS